MMCFDKTLCLLEMSSRLFYSLILSTFIDSWEAELGGIDIHNIVHAWGEVCERFFWKLRSFTCSSLSAYLHCLRHQSCILLRLRLIDRGEWIAMQRNLFYHELKVWWLKELIKLFVNKSFTSYNLNTIQDTINNTAINVLTLPEMLI